MTDVFQKLQDLKDKGKVEVTNEELSKLSPSELRETLSRLPEDKLEPLIKEADERFTSEAEKMELSEEVVKTMMDLLKNKSISIVIPFDNIIRHSDTQGSEIEQLIAFGILKRKSVELMEKTGGYYQVVCLKNLRSLAGEDTTKHTLILEELYDLSNVMDEKDAMKKVQIISGMINAMKPYEDIGYIMRLDSADFNTPKKLAFVISCMTEELKSLGINRPFVIGADRSKIRDAYRGDYIGTIV
jgi:hypothetical protein